MVDKAARDWFDGLQALCPQKLAMSSGFPFDGGTGYTVGYSPENESIPHLSFPFLIVYPSGESREVHQLTDEWFEMLKGVDSSRQKANYQ